MKRMRQHIGQGGIVLASAALFLAVVPLAHAAPSITRLTPPSALFSTGDPDPPIISRFLEDQRFDLQATVALDAGQSLSAAQFLVDGVAVPGLVSMSPATVAGPWSSPSVHTPTASPVSTR